MLGEVLGLYHLRATESLSENTIDVRGLLLNGVGGLVTLLDSRNSDRLTFPHVFDPLLQSNEVFACNQGLTSKLTGYELEVNEQRPDDENSIRTVWSYGLIRDVELRPISLGGRLLHDDVPYWPQ